MLRNGKKKISLCLRKSDLTLKGKFVDGLMFHTERGDK